MSAQTTAGKGFLKFLFAVILVAAIGSVAWVFWVTGDPTRRENWRTGFDEAKGRLMELREQTWGEDGLVEEMRIWLEEQHLGDSGPASVGEEATGEGGGPAEEPAVPEGERERLEERLRTEPSSQTLRLEARLREAEEHFHRGYVHFQKADPAKNGVSDETFAQIDRAKDEFKRVKGILADTIEPYAARGDHDAVKLRDAKRLAQLNNRCLARAVKSGR